MVVGRLVAVVAVAGVLALGAGLGAATQACGGCVEWLGLERPFVAGLGLLLAASVLLGAAVVRGARSMPPG